MKRIALNELEIMLLYVSQRMEENESLLTDLDREIGDGDHGFGMKIGFEAVRKYLNAFHGGTIFDMLRGVSYEFVNTVGGVTGPIFGTLFLGMAKATRERDFIDGGVFYEMLKTAYEDIVRRGGAEEGGKTMIDALGPAMRVAAELKDRDLPDVLEGVAKAARDGAEKTKEMLARFGRAKTLGSRVLGFADPGAVSVALIFEAMRDYLRKGVHRVDRQAN